MTEKDNEEMEAAVVEDNCSYPTKRNAFRRGYTAACKNRPDQQEPYKFAELIGVNVNINDNQITFTLKGKASDFLGVVEVVTASTWALKPCK